ncbi:MAG: VWA-like domain-containing protein, partial [Anaerolineaceae bacterium]
SRPTQELIDLWKQISERAQVDIETASKKWGDLGGGLHQGLNQLNREKYNYASFLKRFSVLGEAMQVNDEEFDLIFYTYGLKLYENMPLIEPLEYKEVKRIKEFVVAIDTSGSVSGQVVQAFVQKTYNILKQTENFFTKVNIHIIQCDAEIQEDYKITNPEEFDKYVQSMQLRGFGGTDFRPVFTYVDDLIKKREFENLRGLIYFTDGFGIYPTKKPLYDTAFVFLDEDYVDTPDVPPWAIKLVLSSDDVMEEGINL